MIRKATLSDIDSILDITKACAHFMIERGILQWNEEYPNKTAFEIDVSRNELFVFEHGNAVIGCMVISEKMDDEYKDTQWLTENMRNLYIHRLAVHPNEQGKGIAQKMMTFAEKYAKTNNYVSIRLDTFSQNRRNQLFYETRGYERLGNVYFPNQSEHPFYCYELVL